MRLLPCAVMALAGCAQLFGIDDTTGTSGGASLQIGRVSIGASVVTGSMDLSAETATFYIPDKNNPMLLVPVPGVLDGTDTWTADIQGNAIAQFSLPDLPMRLQHLWELPVANMTGSFYAFEHPNPQPAPMA